MAMIVMSLVSARSFNSKPSQVLPVYSSSKVVDLHLFFIFLVEVLPVYFSPKVADFHFFLLVDTLTQKSLMRSTTSVVLAYVRVSGGFLR